MNIYDYIVPKEEPDNTVNTTKLTWKFSVVSALSLAAIVLLMVYSPIKHVAYKTRENTPAVKAPVTAPTKSPSETLAAVDAPDPLPNKDDFVLNGVFISDQYKSTLINNRFYQVGDTINGMKIVSIEYEKVILKNKRTSFELASIGNNNLE